MHLVPYSIKDPKTRKLQDFPSMTIACYQLRPESLGSIHIRSADPKAHPAIRFNFLADRIDQDAMTAALSGGGRITTSTGYTVETERLDARLDVLDARSAGPVRATGPIGSLQAGGMQLRHNDVTDTAEMLFTGGVVLVYRPRTPGETDQ